MSEKVLQKQFGMSDEQADKVKKIYDELSEKIIMDDKFNCHFQLNDKIYHMRPMKRKLSRDYTIFLEDMIENKKKKGPFTVNKYNKYQDLVENALSYTITHVTTLEGDTLSEKFDIGELPDPVFDELVLYLNVYFKKYKKK